MKVFNAPKAEIVIFGKDDVIATSTCTCVDCTVCPDGKNDCTCYDIPGSNA